jgi:hypothetical protein
MKRLGLKKITPMRLPLARGEFKRGVILIISTFLLLLVGLAMTGCAVMGPSGHMAGSMDYARQHKGQGLRRAMLGSEAELMETAVKSMEEAGYGVVREPHAVLAKAPSVDVSYAFYFYPSQTNNQTEVEVLIASPWLTDAQMREFQEQTFSSTFFLAVINMKLLEKGYDPNVKEKGAMLALSFAALAGQRNLAKKLINIGADLDLATYELKETASKQVPYLSTPANRKIYDKANLGIDMLNEFKPKKVEPKTDVSTGLTKEDLTTIVQAAVAGATKSQKKEAKPESIETDIDKPSFAIAERIFGDNDVAVLIGIEGYQALPKSDYSYDDARLVKDYLKALGFKERNIELITDEKATKSSIEKSLEAWLKNKAKPDSKVFIYFSGHGAPAPSTGEAYLVPYDGDPNYLNETGYPLKRLYDNLGKLQVAEVVVVLDACFSGAGGRSVLAKGARPLVMMTTTTALPSNIAVLSATQGAQISTSSTEKGHGVLTYYFLKAIKDGKKTLAEIYEYIKPDVEDEAKQLNVQQSPSISPDVKNIMGRFILRK